MSQTGDRSVGHERPDYNRKRVLSGVPWGLAVLCGAIIVIPLSADVLPLKNPQATSLPDRFLEPVFWGGNTEYLLGTDELGRDILSRVIYGGRSSLLVVGGTVIIGGSVGTIVGMIAGYWGGWFDAVVMRLVDATIAFPVLLAALVAATVFGPGIVMVVIILSVAVSVLYIRFIRAVVLSAREADYVLSARLVGRRESAVVLRHILPNIGGQIMVFATLQVGWAVLAEASLSFFGAGLPPDMPSWGIMIAEGRDAVRSAWWVSVVPGLAIMVVVLAFNSLGDFLRDKIDPNTRGD